MTVQPDNSGTPEYFNILKLSGPELQLFLHAYQRAIDASLICTITDTTGNIVYANQRFCDVSQYPLTELLGKNHNLVNSAFHPKEFFTRMWTTITRGGVWHGEIRNRAKDGTYYWVDTVIIPIYDTKLKIGQFLSLRYLITGKKEAEAAREKYTLALEETLRLTSHRVRKPITTCLGLQQVLELDDNKQTYTKEEVKALFSHFKSSAYELELFTRELTNFLQQVVDKGRTA